MEIPQALGSITKVDGLQKCIVFWFFLELGIYLFLLVEFMRHSSKNFKAARVAGHRGIVQIIAA